MNVIHCRHKNCQMTPLDGCSGPCLTDAVKAFNDKVSGKRKPLTDEQIRRSIPLTGASGARLEVVIARAVERAHGIE